MSPVRCVIFVEINWSSARYAMNWIEMLETNFKWKRKWFWVGSRANAFEHLHDNRTIVLRNNIMQFLDFSPFFYHFELVFRFKQYASAANSFYFEQFNSSFLRK